jgi:hypothetical protein
MSVVLVTTWMPRGEGARFERLYASLMAIYEQIVIVAPVQADQDALQQAASHPRVITHISDQHGAGRYLALRLGLETDAPHLHYCDFDRLIRWVELYPDELRDTVNLIRQHEMVVIGRTERAFATHPQSMQQTERLINQIVSHLIGQPLDVTSGSKGFSRAVVQFLLAHTQPGGAIGTDAEWPILAQRAGFALHSIAVEGLDWESADQFRDSAADLHIQREAAEAYDAKSKSWSFRVGLAQQIIDAALETAAKELQR